MCCCSWSEHRVPMLMLVTVYISWVRCHWTLSCRAVSAATHRYAACSCLTVTEPSSTGSDTSPPPTPISSNSPDTLVKSRYYVHYVFNLPVCLCVHAAPGGSGSESLTSGLYVNRASLLIVPAHLFFLLLNWPLSTVLWHSFLCLCCLLESLCFRFVRPSVCACIRACQLAVESCSSSGLKPRQAIQASNLRQFLPRCFVWVIVDMSLSVTVSSIIWHNLVIVSPLSCGLQTQLAS